MRKLFFYFKRFANFINERRQKSGELQEELVKFIPREGKVLEVGCNVRPFIDKNKYPNIELHGLDPDPVIDRKLTAKKFDKFHYSTFEQFDTDEKYDLILFNYVLEHIENNEITFSKVKDLLTENGKMISVQPSNLHPFTIINRILTHDLKIKVLKLFVPWAKVGTMIGWRSYYNNCNIQAFKKLGEKNGLSLSYDKCIYNGSSYFSFFPPLFLLVVFYGELTRILGLKLLCSHFMVILENKNKVEMSAVSAA